MENGTILILIIAVFVALSLIIIGIFKLIVTIAIKKYVIPDLRKKGLIYKGYESTGFSSHGDFTQESDGYVPSIFFSMRGSAQMSLYFYIYYKSSDVDKMITIRIDTVFLVIRRVKYSGEL